jgi:hypothetical protein
MFTRYPTKQELAFKLATHIRGGRVNRYAFRRSMKERRIKLRQAEARFNRAMKRKIDAV